MRDEYLGKEVVITQGIYKGHRGRVTQADDRQAMVELSTVCKKVPIDKTFIKKLDNPEENKQNNDGGRSIYGN